VPPQTITDQRTRFLISCEALESTKENPTFSVFEEAFERYGVPSAIRTDNGVPFSCSRALLGLSKLSIWWLRLGIEIERIKPGNPQENGQHERMDLSLKKDLLKHPAPNLLSQQEIFDRYIDNFNNERPHQAGPTPLTRAKICAKSRLNWKGDLEWPGKNIQQKTSF